MKSVKTMTKKEKKEYYKQYRNVWSINPPNKKGKQK